MKSQQKLKKKKTKGMESKSTIKGCTNLQMYIHVKYYAQRNGEMFKPEIKGI